MRSYKTRFFELIKTKMNNEQNYGTWEEKRFPLFFNHFEGSAVKLACRGTGKLLFIDDLVAESNGDVAMSQCKHG